MTKLIDEIKETIEEAEEKAKGVLANVEEKVKEVVEEVEEKVLAKKPAKKKSSKKMEKEAELESLATEKKEVKPKSLEEKKKELLAKAKKLSEKVDITKTEELKEKVKIKKRSDMLIPLEEYVKSGIYIGTKVVTPKMKPFVYRRRADGLAIFNTDLIDEKLKEGIEYLSKFDAKDIILVCKRQAGWKAAQMFSKLTGIRTFTKNILQEF